MALVVDVARSWAFEEAVDGRDGVGCATSDVDGPAEDTAGLQLEDAGIVTDADAPASCGFDAAF
jgi:hypothetical protein